MVRGNWEQRLQNSFFWYDFFSIPQLCCDPNCGTDLAKAVASIPAYVEKATYMFVLAPVLHHKNFVNAQGLPSTVDYYSWLSRGWCLLEGFAQYLKRDPEPTVVIRSEKYMYLQANTDFLMRRVGHGSYACCAMNHCLEQDGELVHIPCDKHKVGAVVENLVAIRMDHEIEVGEICKYRWFRAMRRSYVTGLPMQGRSASDPNLFTHALDTGRPPSELEMLEMGGSFSQPPVMERLSTSHGIDILTKRVSRTRSSRSSIITPKHINHDIDQNSTMSTVSLPEDTLADFLFAYGFNDLHDNEGGWTPLRYAVLSGNLPMVKRLVSEPGIDLEAPLKKNDEYLGVAKGQTILAHAATYCHDELGEHVLEALCEAKADPEARDALGRNILITASGSCPEGKKWGAEWWLKRFPEFPVNDRIQDPMLNMYAAFVATFNSSETCLTRFLPLLVEKGADLQLRFAISQSDCFSCVCMYSPNSSTSLLEIMYKLGDFNEGHVDRRDEVPRAMRTVMRLLHKLGSKAPIVQEFVLWDHSTPLMMAAAGGKHHIVQWLMDHRADVNARSALGETALQIAERRGFDTVVDVLNRNRPSFDDASIAMLQNSRCSSARSEVPTVNRLVRSISKASVTTQEDFQRTTSLLTNALNAGEPGILANTLNSGAEVTAVCRPARGVAAAAAGSEEEFQRTNSPLSKTASEQTDTALRGCDDAISTVRVWSPPLPDPPPPCPHTGDLEPSQ